MNILTTLRAFIFGLICLIFIASPFQVYALENWPMYNHDSGLTGKTGQYLQGSVTLKWKDQLPTGTHVRSQPIVVDGRVYIGAVGGTLTAYDIVTGQKYWTVNTGGNIFGSPVVIADRVVVPVYFGDKGEVQGYDLSGVKKWTVTSSEPFFSSPIFYRGAIFIGGLDQKLYSIDLEDGVVLWTKDLTGRVLGAPAAKNGTVVVQTDDFKGYGFDVSGTQKWTADLPGEVVRHSNPMIGKNTVLFTTGARAKEMNAIEGQPYYREDPLITNWKGEPPLYNPPEGIISASENYYQQNPQGRTVFAVDLNTGTEKFKVALPTPYWGSLTPMMLTDTLAFKQAHAATWTINMDTGEIKFLDLKMFRGDEYSYSSMGGNQREYGGAADFLGSIDHINKTTNDLIRNAFTHEVPNWQYPPDNNNKYMFVMGPGDGNSGYSGTPVVYDNKIVWIGDGSWLQVAQGTGNNERSDAQAPSVPANLRNNGSSGTTARLAWNVASDNIGVTSYRIYRNTVLIGETDINSFSDVSLTSNTTYQYTVSAVDIQNNESAKSSGVAITAGVGGGSSPSPVASVSPSPSPTADFNGDNHVNGADAVILLQNWLIPTDTRTDLYPDTKTNVFDFASFLLQWTN